MLIALDFDETYTRDTMLWDWFIFTARERDHKIIIVTYRNKEIDIDARLNALANRNIPIVYTDGIAKKPTALAMGFKPDIWIEDKPESVYLDSEFGPEELKVWRSINLDSAGIPTDRVDNLG